jgi:hypothetical protein
MEVVVHPVEFEIKKAEPVMAKPLTDEEISVLWHEAQGQPFKFARLIEKKFLK